MAYANPKAKMQKDKHKSIGSQVKVYKSAQASYASVLLNPPKLQHMCASQYASMLKNKAIQSCSFDYTASQMSFETMLPDVEMSSKFVSALVI